MSRRLLITFAAALLVLAAAPASVDASKPGARGVLPPQAQPLGHSLVDLATAYNAWLIGEPPESSHFLAGDCAPSPTDPGIWFLSEGYPGGPTHAECVVPRGAVLVVSPFFMECSQAEPDPFHGADAAELKACVDADFAMLSAFDMVYDGRAVDVSDYVVTTRPTMIPADNLLGPDPTLSMNKGYFLALAPLGAGKHTFTSSFAVEAMGVSASLEIILTTR